MIAIVSQPADVRLAARLAVELRQRGFDVAETVQPGREHTLVAVLSATSFDGTLRQQVEAALDAGQHVIPVLAASVELPKLIDHLQLVDFSHGHALDELQARLVAAQSPDARLPVRAYTTKVRAANRRAALVVGIVAVGMFLLAIWGIINDYVGVPEEEYAQVETEVAGTRDAIISPTMQFLATALPRSTEQALEFDATLQAIPTLIRPFLALTATANHEILQQFEPTPPAEATE